MKKYHFDMLIKKDQWHGEPKNVMFVEKNLI
jgi:hypothetical protein